MNSAGEEVGQSKRGDANYMSWQNVNRLNFSRKFGKHSVSALAALELYSHTNKYLNASAQGFMTDNIKEISYADKSTVLASSGTTPGQKALLPKVSQVSTKSQMKSTRYLYNRTNFDLSSISLTYSLPNST